MVRLDGADDQNNSLSTQLLHAHTLTNMAPCTRLTCKSKRSATQTLEDNTYLGRTLRLRPPRPRARPLEAFMSVGANRERQQRRRGHPEATGFKESVYCSLRSHLKSTSSLECARAERGHDAAFRVHTELQVLEDASNFM